MQQKHPSTELSTLYSVVHGDFKFAAYMIKFLQPGQKHQNLVLMLCFNALS